tara:strand:+ start:231 stop:758 length:528 start_codon:yes stop_codon:yes gene_type:complete
MNSAIIIETPLVEFYYSFKHHNNIMFVEITEKLLYTEHIFTKLYYCMYNEFITKTNWFDFYKLSLISSKPINNNTEMIVNVFWCLYNKVEPKCISVIKESHCANNLKFFIYKPTTIMINGIINCIINYIINNILIIEDVIDTVSIYHKLVIFCIYAEKTLKINTNCIELILKECY